MRVGEALRRLAPSTVYDSAARSISATFSGPPHATRSKRTNAAARRRIVATSHHHHLRSQSSTTVPFLPTGHRVRPSPVHRSAIGSAPPYASTNSAQPSLPERQSPQRSRRAKPTSAASQGNGLPQIRQGGAQRYPPVIWKRIGQARLQVAHDDGQASRTRSSEALWIRQGVRCTSLVTQRGKGRTPRSVMTRRVAGAPRSAVLGRSLECSLVYPIW